MHSLLRRTTTCRVSIGLTSFTLAFSPCAYASDAQGIPCDVVVSWTKNAETQRDKGATEEQLRRAFIVSYGADMREMPTVDRATKLVFRSKGNAASASVAKSCK